MKTLSIACVIALAACCSTARVRAQHLTYEDLTTAQQNPTVLSDSAFAMPANASPAAQSFEGELQLLPPKGYGFAKIISTRYESLRTDTLWKQLPPFRMDFVQDGSHLIPAKQGLIYTGSLAWNLIVGPGRVWQEAGDNGYSRASLPFALVERGQNCVHNGELMFLFRSGSSPSVSQVRYQITQETCDYMKADMWGQVPARYTAHAVPGATSLKKAFEQEMAQRVPRKPLSALNTDFPAAHFDVAALLRGREHPEDVTFYGLYVNGVNYTSGCRTRHGDYAFCAEMRVPSYSTAKSAFAGMAMMHLGALFGQGIYSMPLAENLPASAPSSPWKGVTVSNTLDMASGHFFSTGFEHDEDGPMMKFLVDESLHEKVKDALSFPAALDPGKIFIYHSSDTFLTTLAMDHILDQELGHRMDLFNWMRRDIYDPIHLSQGFSTLRTDNSPEGMAPGYFGLFYISDDIVKIGRFVNESGGLLDGKTVLDPARLRESLFRAPATKGLAANDPRQVADTVHYNHGFWARHFTPTEYPQLGCDFWAAYMSGYGGNTIALLPNHVVFYVFSDADEFVYNDAILETNKLSPLCRAH